MRFQGENDNGYPSQDDEEQNGLFPGSGGNAQGGPLDNGGSFNGGLPSADPTQAQPQIGTISQAQKGETPREREVVQSTPGASVGNYGGAPDENQGGGGNSAPSYTSTPRKPTTPDIRAGQVSTVSGGADSASTEPSMRSLPTGVIPFEPMGPVGSPGGGSSALFGSVGGLKGGGLGVPGFSSPDTGSIDQLMAMLTQKKGLF